MFGKVQSAWEAGKQHETSWWLEYLRESLDKDQDFQARCRGETDFVFAHLIAPGVRQPRILDVGAGPVTQVGLRHPSLEINITAVDPLAREYTGILKDIEVNPTVITSYGEAEHLNKLFEPGSFDFAYCRNALDHSFNPLEGIWQTVQTLKPGAHFYLCGFANEGEEGCYVGLHQWNFDVRDGRFIIWRPGVTFDVAEALSGDVEVVEAKADKRWYMITMRRPSES